MSKAGTWCAGALLTLIVAAGPPPAPATYQDAFVALQERLDAFDETLSGTTFSGDIPMTAGSNEIEVRMSDGFGNSVARTYAVEGDASLPPVSTGGGGGHSGCGLLGLEALAVIWTLRARARARSPRW